MKFIVTISVFYNITNAYKYPLSLKLTYVCVFINYSSVGFDGYPADLELNVFQKLLQKPYKNRYFYL